MSTEAQKSVEPTEVAAPVAPVVPVEPVPASAPVESEGKAVEAEPKLTEETSKVDGETATAAPLEEKKEEKPVEPIYSGALGYKAPGLKNIFRFSKKYFWFGEEAAVPTSSLTQYLRGEKAEIAHPTAAWSSVTGKGLLFFVKHADQKETPAGVLNLADATELSKDGTIAFHFKLHGDKHSFEATSAPERNGWFVAFEKVIGEAKAAKDGIVSSEAYKEEKKKLEKPTSLAPTAAATTPKKSTEVVPKKSTEAAPKLAEGEAAAAAPTEEAVVPVRTGSSSSSSDEDKKKKKASKSKSRSVSRGKRASIFGSILGKKDKAEEKVDEKKEETKEKAEEKEAKKEDAAPVAEPSTAVPATTAPVITEDLPKPVEDAKAEETPVAAVAEEKKAEEKPKPTKRTSIFGNFVEKLKSPTHEKKEPELTPVAKEPEVSAEAPKLEETPKVEEAPLAPVTDVVDSAVDVPKNSEEVKPAAAATTPAKEKQHFSFGKFLGGGKEKVKSPTTEKAPEAPKTEENPKLEEMPAPVAPVDPVDPAVPAVPAAEPATEATKEEKKEEPASEAPTTTPAAKKRGSLFGSLGGSVKKEKDGEEKPQGLKGLFRNASKAGKSKKEKEPTIAPPKVEEVVEPSEEKAEAAPVTEEKKTETPVAPTSTEQAAIGDVVPDAVTVGQAPKSSPAVASSA